ncbi:hypothetical protein BUALT_Bualt05G0126500 [Buddleja alternifolia]|uniref:DUF4218 domain-containing protein n=1 Tax=Buddleja alternifolia TaxID=168488 RepID=A0AAV6XS48_9LAMI|nr:hypothetical protein BUALT_Bualt05G0126500 [Buddleja alternifolia]
MRWHKENPGEEGKLYHPRDGEAWKHFDHTHPSFAAESRNVRLALSADGFNPHNQGSRPYSCWPVIVTPYNLPPWMCMDRPYMFLTLLVPGPKSPGRSLDVYLQPLIDELKTLWDVGVETYDVSRKQNFQMKATLMWTISDFPAYGMLSGWSTHGKLACPYCMNHIKSFRLKHGRKPCFFYCHRQFLPLDHSYRYQKDNFTKGRIEIDEPPIRSTGDEVEAAVSLLPNIEHGKTNEKERIEGFGETHNWLKRSIFWDLPYWKTNSIRHNLDVMHIEKNVFDNVFNMVMNVKGKTKDNINACLDLQNVCKRRNLNLKEVNEKCLKPKASYALTKDERQMLLKWIKDLRLPDGYVSNLGRCVNLDDYSMHGMKSHDCHVFMERLIPLTFRDLLPEPVWNALTELSQFFRDLCSTVLSESNMKKMEENIVVTLFLNTLKRKVKNKARVEGSIVEAYLIEETSTFCSHFFAPNVETRSRTIGRNDNINQVEHVENSANQITNNDIKRLSRGFNSILKCWNGHIVNGYRFHTIEYGKGKSTMNSGVSISGSYYNDSIIEYYGELLEILELSFLGPGDNTVVMFKCKWFDSGRLGTKIHPRSTYEISHTSIPSEQTPLEEFYQETSSSNLAHVVLDNELDEIDILIDVHREEEEPTRGRYTGTYMSLLNGNVKALGDLHEDLAEHDDMAEHDNLAEHDDMAEHDDLADEEVHPGMDDLPHAIKQKESDCKDEIERDEVGREILIIVENCFVSTAAPRTILPSLRGWYNGVWPTFTKIPDRVNQELFDLFKSKKNGGNPVLFEKTFERCHRRNKGQGPFVDKKLKNTLETYTEKLKQNQSQSDGPTMLPSVKASCIIYPEAWAEASSGPKFGRCYGFGTSYSESSSSSIHSSSINRSQGIKDGIKDALTSLSMYPIQHPSPGHLSASAPGYFPPHPGYCPSPGYYPAPGQHHPFQYQPSSRDHSPDEHHTRD